MRIKRILFITFVAAMSLLCARLAHAEEAAISAYVDKQTVYEGEEVNLRIKISGAGSNLPAPKLPQFQGFDTFYSGRASHFTFINGRSESTIEFNYVLVPKLAGSFLLSPIGVDIKGKAYQTEPIQIEVLGQSSHMNLPVPPVQAQPAQPSFPVPSFSSAPRSQLPPTPVSYGGDENIFLRVQPSKRTVYTNEQLLLVYSLLTRYDTRYEGFEQEPETSGFWIEEFPMERDIGKQTETIERRKFVRADIRKMALFPTSPGEYTIKPGSIKVSVQIEQRPTSLLDEFFSDSFFSGTGLFSRRADKVLIASPITVVVKPLPEVDKPSSFNGAVGEFRISSSVDQKEVGQNEPITLQLVVEGEGNIETLGHPNIPELSDAKVYESDTKSDFFKAQDRIAGKKTFEIIFIPKLAGTFTIPQLEFSYFNSRTEKYEALRTGPYAIQVKPSLTPPPELPKELGIREAEAREKIKLEGKDIRYVHERLREFPRYQDYFLVLLVGLNGLLTVGSGLIGWFRKREEYLNSNIALKRNKLADRLAKRALKHLQLLARKGGSENEQHFFDEAERVINQYLADKLNLSPQGLTQSLIAEKLAERGVSTELIKKIQQFYDDYGLARFGPPGSFAKRSHDLLESTQSILKEQIR